MRKLFFFLLTIAFSLSINALNIPKGYIYFDNSKTAYQTVRFVYGSDTKPETYAYEMTFDGKKWTVQIPSTVRNMYRFTFVGGNIKAGKYNQTFSAFKDSISNQLSLSRTATSSTQMNANDIYVPSSGDNWAQGTWMTLNEWQNTQTQAGTATLTGTLPVIYVNTENKQAIADKETQIPATIYIDPVLDTYLPLGSEQEQLPATIKGRGNYTWKDFDKKPYKIKFNVKQKVLGMPNNKHWCLMAGADDWMGFLKNPTGYMLSNAIGLRWTPRMVPVELVLNGKYQGLYFLTEHVRIASNRVKITEQEEKETNKDNITGGWLIEIDNYSSEGNILYSSRHGYDIMVSLKEPEVLSTQQREYLTSQVNTLFADIENQKTNLAQKLDIREAAKYYLVQEIMEDCESYHGSCFLYKDRDSLGVVDKWKFGPVWDFGNAYDRHQENWIYVRPTFAQYLIGDLAQNNDFQKALAEEWWIFYHTKKDSVRAQISTFANTIAQAAKNDAAVWKGTKNYNDNSNMSYKSGQLLERYDWRIQWLYSQWGEGTKPPTWGTGTSINTVHTDSNNARKFIRNGQIFIERNGRTYTITGHLAE